MKFNPYWLTFKKYKFNSTKNGKLFHSRYPNFEPSFLQANFLLKSQQDVCVCVALENHLIHAHLSGALASECAGCSSCGGIRMRDIKISRRLTDRFAVYLEQIRRLCHWQMGTPSLSQNAKNSPELRARGEKQFAIECTRHVLRFRWGARTTAAHRQRQYQSRRGSVWDNINPITTASQPNRSRHRCCEQKTFSLHIT